MGSSTSTHLLGSILFVWLVRVALSRNLMKTTKNHQFPMVGKSCTHISRHSSALGSYKLGILDFDTSSRNLFFCFASSCCIIEKFDENHQNLLQNSYLVFLEHENHAQRVRKSAGAGSNAPGHVLSQSASKMSIETVGVCDLW